MNLVFAFLWIIRNEPGRGRTRRRRRSGGSGKGGDCSPRWEQCTKVFLLALGALLASPVCILRIILTVEFGARLLGFLCSTSWVTVGHPCETHWNSPLPVLELLQGLWRGFLCSLFLVCKSNLLRLKDLCPYPDYWDLWQGNCIKFNKLISGRSA